MSVENNENQESNLIEAEVKAERMGRGNWVSIDSVLDEDPRDNRRSHSLTGPAYAALNRIEGRERHSKSRKSSSNLQDA